MRRKEKKKKHMRDAKILTVANNRYAKLSRTNNEAVWSFIWADATLTDAQRNCRN